MKLSLFADDMILHIENPKDCTHTHTHKVGINEFNKVAGYKYIKICCIFLYQPLSEGEKKKSHLRLHQK